MDLVFYTIVCQKFIRSLFNLFLNFFDFFCSSTSSLSLPFPMLIGFDALWWDEMVIPVYMATYGFVYNICLYFTCFLRLLFLWRGGSCSLFSVLYLSSVKLRLRNYAVTLRFFLSFKHESFVLARAVFYLSTLYFKCMTLAGVQGGKGRGGWRPRRHGIPSIRGWRVAALLLLNWIFRWEVERGCMDAWYPCSR